MRSQRSGPGMKSFLERIARASIEFTSSASDRFLAAWLVVCLGVVYVPDMGRGFIADDFSWIWFNRGHDLNALVRPFVETPMGFFRPIVALSFVVDHAVYGMAPFPYAFTNLAIVVITLAAIVALARVNGATFRAGLFAAGLWAFNFHGVAMALTWISGRTSLLTTMFAVLAAVALARHWSLTAGLLALFALLSKEEPVLLPAILALWTALDWREANGSVRASASVAVRRTWPLFVALLLYLGWRARTPAFTPWTAPAAYTLSLSPRVLVPNTLEYLDRSLTFVAAVLVLGFVLFVRRRFSLAPRERALAMKGAIWLALGFGATIMVPIRSDLYACFPSVGSALIGISIGAALWRAIPERQRAVAVLLICLLPLALLPVYRARNVFAKNDAIASSRVVSAIATQLTAHPRVLRIEVLDDPADKGGVSMLFRGTLSRALELTVDRPIAVAILPTSGPATDRQLSPPDTLRFAFTGRAGVVVPVGAVTN